MILCLTEDDLRGMHVVDLDVSISRPGEPPLVVVTPRVELRGGDAEGLAAATYTDAAAMAGETDDDLATAEAAAVVELQAAVRRWAAVRLAQLTRTPAA